MVSEGKAEGYTMDDYIKALESHDWHYQYSEDITVWRRGVSSYERIVLMSKDLDPTLEIFDKYRPKD